MKKEWKGFIEGTWCTEINVSEFIKKNYVAYDGDDSFLETISDKTRLSPS